VQQETYAVGVDYGTVSGRALVGRVERGKYQPNPEAAEAYDGLFAEYPLLHDYVGRGANDVMKRLKAMRKEALA